MREEDWLNSAAIDQRTPDEHHLRAGRAPALEEAARSMEELASE